MESRVANSLASLCVFLFLSGDLAANDRERDLRFILRGVEKIALPGVPGGLCVFGDEAFPIAMATKDGHMVPVVAAGALERGRLVAFSHGGFFDEALRTANTGRLMMNLIYWSGGATATPPQPLKIGVRDADFIFNSLKKAGRQVVLLDDDKWADSLAGLNVVLTRSRKLTAGEVQRLDRFVRAGGGLICADAGWVWQKYDAAPAQRLAVDFPINRLFGSAGIGWTDGTVKPPTTGATAVDDNGSPLVHGKSAFDFLATALRRRGPPDAAKLGQAVFTLSSAVRFAPPDDRLLLPRLDALLNARSKTTPKPSAERPLSQADSLARAVVKLRMQRSLTAPLDQLDVHPAAATFPGTVPKRTPRVTKSITIDTSIPRWHSTALYAVRGEVVTVKFDKRAVDKKLVVRIGAHKDKLWESVAWKRIPEITRQFPVQSTVTKVANAFGGLIYIDVPADCMLGKIELEVSGAVEAPLYVHGKTDLANWRNTIRNDPAPWAELASDKFIITLPSAVIRKQDRPDQVMEFWNQVLDACADLATIPRDRAPPERFVIDVQISNGLMHAGYPIMALLQYFDTVQDLDSLKSKGNWGIYHEIGHNHQSLDWTYRGMTEVTVNLFSLYALETLNPGAAVHVRVNQEGAKRLIREFEISGQKGDPFLELVPYMQMQKEFGWEAYKKVFAEYRDLRAAERPKTDDEKRDQWLVRFSNAVGHDLGPFFQYWKIPTSPKARQSVSQLPKWKPSWPEQE